MKHGLFLNPSRGDPQFFEPGPVGDIVSQMGTRQICLMFGFSGQSKVAEAEARPDSEKWYKYIRLLPLNQEWERYIAFMATNIGQDGFYMPTGRKQASMEFSTKWGKMGAGNGEDDDEDELFAVLKGAKFGKSQSGHASSSRTPGNIITGHSITPLALNHWDQIAVYDCTRFFQGKDSRKLNESFDLAKVRATCPLWKKEVPVGSFICVLHSPVKWMAAAKTDNPKLSLSLNLLAICIIVSRL
ncbi:hypothetical protein SCP_1103680 [Sparassis crispa]|uniref:Uncharacterized protein n=1 Tax=Sparassis crispa TaxID=139825 RepID=A0A401GZU8_9APHY|nr:hypothetical protein SCP_1103680 [Sparassis crispa]GBE87691.1 hypothetical protein SCP_1103680 [Sparassis crispa]